MGDPNRQPAHYAAAKGSQPLMEFLRACHNRQNYADVLYDVQGFLEHPEKDWEDALAALMESPPKTEEAGK